MKGSVLPLAAMLLAFPGVGADGATACDEPGEALPAYLAAGVVEPGDLHAYPIDDVGGDLLTVWPQKAPDTHGPFHWALRDRATGDVLDQGDAVEIPSLRFSGVSPYDDLCLEVSTAQSLPTEYAILVTATEQS